MQSLVDKSLLRHNEGRYWMLETIREHAEEKLEASARPTSCADATHSTFWRSRKRRSRTSARSRSAAVTTTSTGSTASRRSTTTCERRSTGWRRPARRSSSCAAGALVEFWFENAHFVELRTRLLAALEADGRADRASREGAPRGM